MKGQTLMIVRIRMSDGIVGVGQGTTVGGLAYGPENPEDMKCDRYLRESDPAAEQPESHGRDQQAGSGK